MNTNTNNEFEDLYYRGTQYLQTAMVKVMANRDLVQNVDKFKALHDQLLYNLEHVTSKGVREMAADMGVAMTEQGTDIGVCLPVIVDGQAVHDRLWIGNTGNAYVAINTTGAQQGPFREGGNYILGTPKGFEEAACEIARLLEAYENWYNETYAAVAA